MILLVITGVFMFGVFIGYSLVNAENKILKQENKILIEEMSRNASIL